MNVGWEGRCFGFFLVLGAGAVAVDTSVVDPLVVDLIAGPPEWIEELVTLCVSVFVTLGLVMLMAGLATSRTRAEAEAGPEKAGPEKGGPPDS